MALSNSTIGEIRTGGSDTNGSGLFDPSKVSAGGNTDGAATNANTNSPVFTSVSYSFVAGDQFAWLYIDSGTNWIPGWYQIASVSGGAATLTATIGTAVLSSLNSMNTVAGCATTASPTGAKWTIDYSQQDSSEITYTDLSSGANVLTATSAAHPFGKQQVGNSIVVTGGTNFNTGRYVIASVSGVTATFVGPTNIHGSGSNSDGAGRLGGALLSPGIMTSLVNTPGIIGFMRNDSSIFSITSASSNVSQGVLNASNMKIIGYATNRNLNNTDNAPTLQLNVSTATMFGALQGATNIICDGNSQTAAKLSSGTNFERCTIKNFNTTTTGTCHFRECYATTNSATVFVGICDFCVAKANTATPYNVAAAFRCISDSNTGASTDGFLGATSSTLNQCTSYNNGRDGYRNIQRGTNLIAESNVGSAFLDSSGGRGVMLQSCADFGNASRLSGTIQDNNPVACSVSALTNPGSGDFSLNNAAGGGALLRGKGYPGAFTNESSTSYPDVGAVQHRDPARASLVLGI